MFAIIDIETTGGSAQYERITEIAVYIHDGFQIIDSFSSLVNPERPIPPYVAKLTGISNEMVANAPKFYEIAKKVIEITEGKIFIAHNVNFDYNFIRQEFKSLGYEFNRKKLCTVQLSRKLIPGKQSYSLGKICLELGIVIPPEQRHRAAGDALATVKLFEFLLSQNTSNELLHELEKNDAFKRLKSEAHKHLIDNLPEDTGVYYLHNSKGEIIYIGKSINIRDRILQHLNNYSSQKGIDIINNLHEVSFELTGSDVIACLLESAEIKKHKPVYNRSQRRSVFNYGAFASYDPKGYINFRIDKTIKNEEPFLTFTTLTEGKEFLRKAIEKNNLCLKLSGLHDTANDCFHYQLKKCNGACIGQEAPERYNERAKSVLNQYMYRHDSFLLIDSGRNSNEKAVICVANGKYKGFGYFDPEFCNDDLEVIKGSIKKYADNRDVQQIIRTSLNNKKYQKLILLK